MAKQSTVTCLFICSSSDSDSESEAELKFVEPQPKRKKKKHKKNKNFDKDGTRKCKSERPNTSSVSEALLGCNGFH